MSIRLESAEWQALHVFYTANSRPMITQCLHPLITDLRERGLIERYFFINYWLGGPHVRLRLLPSSKAVTGEVLECTELALDEFLRTRPALYEVTSDHMLNYYDKLFEVEYSDQDWSPHLGADGRMLLRKNNSHRREAYEPEYDKYGGPSGVALSEWHFERSSDLVSEVDRTMNVHLRTVRLGVSLQLMVVMASNFLPGIDAIGEFFEGYKQFWHQSFEGSDFVTEKGYERHYDTLADRVGRRVREIQEAVLSEELDRLPTFLRSWSDHCRELSDRVHELAPAGELVFGFSDGVRQTVTDPARALKILLSPYVHMTNNRLTTTIGDESYLAHLLSRVLRERPNAEVAS